MSNINIEREVSELIKRGADRVSMKELRHKFGDDKVFDMIQEAYFEKLSSIRKRSIKFIKLIEHKYGMHGYPLHVILNKALKYKKKYKLTEEEFELFRQYYQKSINMRNNANKYDVLVPNTNMAKVFGDDPYANDKIHISDEDHNLVKDIITLYDMNRVIWQQITLQSITYNYNSLILQSNTNIDYSQANLLSFIHPVVAAMFLPKITRFDEYFLFTNLAYILRCKYLGEPISTYHSYLMLYNLVTDPTDVVCNADSPLKDILNRVMLQVTLWKNVLRLRQGDYYDTDESFDAAEFMAHIDNCKLSTHDAPDLIMIGDENVIIRRLLTAFAFRCATVLSTPTVFPLFNNGTNSNMHVSTLNIPVNYTQVTKVPMIYIRLPTVGIQMPNIIQSQTITVQSALNTIQPIIYNGKLESISLSVIGSNGVLIVSIPRRTYRPILGSIYNLPQVFNMSNLPHHVFGLEVLNDTIVDADYCLSIGSNNENNIKYPYPNIVFMKSTVVLKEKQDQKENYIYGSKTYIFDYDKAQIATYDPIHDRTQQTINYKALRKPNNLDTNYDFFKRQTILIYTNEFLNNNGNGNGNGNMLGGSRNDIYKQIIENKEEYNKTKDSALLKKVYIGYCDRKEQTLNCIEYFGSGIVTDDNKKDDNKKDNNIKDDFKLIIETNPTNFGHNKLIYQGDINFPPRDDNKTNGSNNYGYNGYGGNYDNNDNDIKEAVFNKQQEIINKYYNNKFIKVKDQQKYFTLYRYGINKLNKPNDNKAPTLSMSLFMPNDKFPNKDIKNINDWINKYYIKQLVMILIFNYYFPNGNYRNYLDWYMLSYFEKLPQDYITISKLIQKFKYIEFEEDNIILVQNFLNKCYNKLKEYDNINFKNAKERFIFYFDFAAKCYNDNGKLEIREKTGDLFVYKFSGPFIENVNTPLEGHITNGYIGQLIRYISLRQDTYDYDSNTINRPTHLVWRDAHTNVISYNDAKMINTFNNECLNNKEVYLLPSSIFYEPGWNDIVKCNSNKTQNYTRSAIAGWVQMINNKSNNNWLSDLDYLCSIGMAFIINNEELPLINHRPQTQVSYIMNNKILNKYNYGIDEYILSSLFTIDYFKNKSIYINHNFLGNNNKAEDFYWQYKNTILNSFMILLKYLSDNNITYNNDYELIQKIEDIRNTRFFENEEIKKCLRIILAIIPTKYHIVSTYYANENLNSMKYQKVIDFDEVIKFYSDEEKQYLNEPLSLEKLKKLKVSCYSTSLLTSSEWCIRPYIYKKSNETNCPPENYFSGFYYEEPPSLDIGIIRQPSDLKYAIKALENNNLKIKLNRSDYKINVENENFKNDVQKNIDGDNGHIKAALQNIILLYGDIDPDFGITQGEIIAGSVAELNYDATTQSKVWCPLIWKALNLANYDVPREWYQVKLKDADYAKFNSKIIELANLPGWAKYAVEVLTSDNDNYNENDNSFESQIVITKANNYKNSAKDKDFSKYTMSSY
jgi:hypothetical protein